MTSFPRRTEAPSLRDVIDAYRVEQRGELDQWALILLARLGASRDAAEAFKRLKRHHADVPGISSVRGANVLLWCTMAELGFRRFPHEFKNAQKTLVRIGQFDNALAELHQFIVEQQFLPPFGQLSSARKAAMEHGLNLIGDRIGECRLTKRHYVSARGNS